MHVMLTENEFIDGRSNFMKQVHEDKWDPAPFFITKLNFFHSIKIKINI